MARLHFDQSKYPHATTPDVTRSPGHQPIPKFVFRTWYRQLCLQHGWSKVFCVLVNMIQCTYCPLQLFELTSQPSVLSMTHLLKVACNLGYSKVETNLLPIWKEYKVMIYLLFDRNFLAQRRSSWPYSSMYLFKMVPLERRVQQIYLIITTTYYWHALSLSRY